MAGEQVAFRRAATGSPVADYTRLVDRQRVNLGGKGTNQSMVVTAASSLAGVQVTASATPHTKGTAVELVASTGFMTESIDVLTRGVGVSVTDTSVLCDIVTGASLNTVLIPNIMTGYQQAATGLYHCYNFPVSIPAGTRVGAQIQGTEVSETQFIAVRLHQSGTHSMAGSSVTAIGVNTATSNGVLVAAPGATNTKPTSFTTILDPTVEAYRWLVVAMSIPAGSTNVTANEGLLDIAVGAASSETVIIPDIQFALTSTEEIRFGGTPHAHYVGLPSGVRLSARYQSITTATAARPSVAVYGIP